ncbi:MAG: hypothetical protein WD027_06440 [Gaiellales bacterium]
MARLVVTLAATLVAAFGSLALGTPQAAASSQGCTYTKFPSHYVCFSINGSGTYVSTFDVIRGKLDWDNDICNHRAKVVVRHRGSVIWSRTSSVRQGCQIFRVVRTFGAYRRFPSPSYACGSFYENGVLQDTACNWIHD